jgi:hypothetical protein
MEDDIRKYWILQTMIAQGLNMGYNGFESNEEVEVEVELSKGDWILSDGTNLGSSWDIILNPEFSKLVWGEEYKTVLQDMVLLTEDERVEYLSGYVNFEDDNDSPKQDEEDNLVKDALMITIMKSQEMTKSASMQMFRYNCENIYKALKPLVKKTSATELVLEDFVELNVQSQEMEGLLSSYLNDNGKASFTVCPECGVDDFTHSENCSIYQRVEDRFLDNEDNAC